MTTPVAVAVKESPAAQSAGRAPAHVARPPRPVFAPPVVLQRKCACGGSCSECAEEKANGPPLQAKLQIDTPGDAFEAEADRMAERVVSMGSAQPGPAFAGSPTVVAPKVLQRKCACGGGCSGCKQDDEVLQRKTASNEAAGASATEVHPQALGIGAPLDSPTQTFMESRFDADFSDVRIHTGTRATTAARSVNALAYTVGKDIVFGDGQYSPTTTVGQRLLAHELTHVLQQRSSQIALQRKEDEAPEGIGGEPTVECPPVPTGLGKKDPDLPKGPCPRANYAGTNKVSQWLFCLDSDQIHPSDSLNTLPGLIAPHPRATRYLVHGHSSTDGNADYNFRLSCHRAHKVGDALLAALKTKLTDKLTDTVTDAEIHDRVQVASRGATNEFPGGPHLNRVAVLYAEIPGIEPDEEPACKDAPRRLGDIRPEVPCDTPTMDLTGRSGGKRLQHFNFCLDSDVLFGSTPAAITKFAGRQAASATYVVHGFASSEGDAAYNQRLSCHRALRVFRELMNAGVRPEQVREVSGIGETDAFSFGVKELEPANRVAVVLAEGGEISPLIDPKTSPATDKDKQAVVDAARARITSGQYESAADFYISFWTCGRTATVRQAVERLTVKLPRERGRANGPQERNLANGFEEHPELEMNHVRISNTALGADNPTECTMGRLIDMAFHHAVRGDPSLPTKLAGDSGFALRHQAGLHLTALAGLTACKGRFAEPGEKSGEKTGIDVPVDDDPLTTLPKPACARTLQPSRLLAPTPGEKDREAPQFEVVGEPKFVPGSGKVTSSTGKEVKASGIVHTTQETDIVSAEAEIRLVGKPEVFGDYEIGFVQNLLADRTVVDYSSGHQVIQQLPVPIRLTSNSGGGAVPAPWATPATERRALEGTITVKSGSRLPSINAIFLRSFGPTLPSGVMDRAVRQARIATWLVARRLAGPLDRYSVHVLGQAVHDLTQTVGLEHRHIRGELTRLNVELEGGETDLAFFTGDFVSTPAPVAADPEAARLLTPVAADIDLPRQTSRIVDAAASTEIGGVDRRPTYETIVRRTLDELVVFDSEKEATSGEPGKVVPRLGFIFSPLTIRVAVDRRTGRMRNAENKEDIRVSIASPELDVDALNALSQALDLRLGNTNFLRNMFGRDVVLKPSVTASLPRDRRNPNIPELGEVEIDLPPLGPVDVDPQSAGPQDLWDRSDVRQDMAKIWACTELSRRIELGEREFGIAYWMDRDHVLRRGPIEMGECCPFGPPCKTNLPCGPNVPARFAGFAVGTVHSHPHFSGLEAAQPSASEDKEEPDDRKLAKSGKCGRQHYIVSEDVILQYFTEHPQKKDNTRLRKDLPKGEKCPLDIPPC